MLFQLVHVHSADQNHHPAAFHTQRRSCLHISQLSLTRDERFRWENPLYQVSLRLSNQSAFIWLILFYDIIFLLWEQIIHYIPSHSYTCKFGVWLHWDAACWFPLLGFFVYGSGFSARDAAHVMLCFSALIFLQSIHFCHCLPHLVGGWRKADKSKKSFFLPVMLTNIHISVIFLCSFPCLWLFLLISTFFCAFFLFSPSYLLSVFPPQLLLKMQQEVDFIFQTLLLHGVSIVQRPGGRSLCSCSWLVRMRLLSSVLHLSLIVLSSSSADSVGLWF